jgi:malate dehydrogenase (oxaloacetate-decarboxylating)(NADP+)
VTELNLIRNVLNFDIVSQGKCIFASGSPFPPVEFEGKVYKPGQGNNAYVFPGIALGVICTGMHHISEDAFLISSQVTD